MKNTIYIILIFCTFLQANEIKEAEELEKTGKYKEANLLYKKLLKKDSSENKLIDFFEKRIDKSDDKETNLSIKQVLTSSFGMYAYKDNYFLPFSYSNTNKDGRKNLEAKFQFSFKKEISYNYFSLNESINVAYTQKSYWQIYKDSSPFRESNYQPEIFIIFPYYKLDYTSLKAYKISFMHESNGRDGLNSRSWNKIYLETYFQYKEFFISPKIWYRIPEKDDDNSDLLDYYGYLELNIFHAYKSNILKLKLRNNLKFNKNNKGFIELSNSFALNKKAFVFFQISSGYVDSLIDYDKEINRISFGISLSR